MPLVLGVTATSTPWLRLLTMVVSAACPLKIMGFFMVSVPLQVQVPSNNNGATVGRGIDGSLNGPLLSASWRSGPTGSSASALSGDCKPLALISALLSSFSRPLESYNFRRLVSCATSFSSAANTIFRCSTSSPTTLQHSAPRFVYKFGLLAALPLLTRLR